MAQCFAEQLYCAVIYGDLMILLHLQNGALMSSFAQVSFVFCIWSLFFFSFLYFYWYWELNIDKYLSTALALSSDSQVAKD